MLSSLRIEVRNQLLKEAETGLIPLSSSERKTYEAEYKSLSNMPEDVWRVLLRHYQARYFRFVIFCSSRSPEDSKDYLFTRDLAYDVVDACRTDIVSGGGPGSMRAALEGLHLARQNATANGRIIKAKALGITIVTLPNDEKPCEFLDKESPHKEFSTRLQEFMDISHAAYVAPGGIGTNLELTWLLQAKQVDHLEREYPVMVSSYWEEVIKAMKYTMYIRPHLENAIPFINEDDMDFLTITDSIPQIVDKVLQSRNRWRESINRHVKIVL